MEIGAIVNVKSAVYRNQIIVMESDIAALQDVMKSVLHSWFFLYATSKERATKSMDGYQLSRL